MHSQRGRNLAGGGPADARSGHPNPGGVSGSSVDGPGVWWHVKLHAPVHGKATTIEHDGRTIFKGLSSPLKVGRYHSLVVDEPLPDCLEATARGGGVLMGLRHRELPAEGVQFHPESVLTDEGKQLLRELSRSCWCRRRRRLGDPRRMKP